MALFNKQLYRLTSFITRRTYSRLVLQHNINPEQDLSELKLSQLVHKLQTMPSNDAHNLLFNTSRRTRILENADQQIRNGNNSIQQEALNEIYKSYFTQMNQGRGASFLLSDLTFMLEERLLNDVNQLIEPLYSKLITQIPTDSSKSFIRWLLKIIQTHPATSHPFYNKFIRNEATREDLRFWLAQESTLDQRFDDVLANLQVGTTGSIKMEIAKNYWDEMGNGDLEKTHTHLFAQLLDELEVTSSYIAANLLPASLLTGNLSACFSLHRHLFHEALGFFGVVEYLAPLRFTNVVKAFQRNGISEKGQTYHKLHIWIDRIHGASWFNDVVRSIVEENPETKKAVLKGVLIRLETSLIHLNSFPTSSRVNAIKEKQQ